MESDPQERESDDNSMLIGCLKLNVPTMLPLSHNDEPLSDGDVDSGHDQDDSCEGMKQIANGQTLTDHNDVLNKLKRQVREIRGGDDYEPERPVNFSTPHKSMPIPEPGPFHVPPIYSNYQNAAAAAAAFMTPLVPPQQPQPNPVSSGGSSLSSNDSGSHNWSFEEQFKQVRQLYELDNAPGRREFLDELFAFMQQRGTPINRLPIMAKSVLDLFNLYNLVISRGGLVEVINKKLWQEIIKGLKLPSSITSAAFTLRTQYMKYLYEYETEKMNLSTREELQAAIDSNRREGRRTSYGTYESAMRHPDTSMVVAHLNNQMAPLPPMVQAAAAAAAAAAHQQQQQQQLAVHLSNAMSLSNGLAHPHNGPSASPASHLPPLPPHGGHLVPPTSHAPGSSSAANGVPAPGAGTELEQRMIDFFNTQVLLQQHNATIFQAGQNMDLSRLALFSQIASSLNNQRQAAILAAAAQQQHHQQQQQQQQNLMNNEHQQHQEQQQQQRQSPAAPFRFGLPHHSPPLPMSALAMMEQMNRATSPEQHEALNLSDPNSQGPSGLNGSAVAAVAGNSNCNTSGRRGKKRPSRSSTPLEQQQQEKRRPGSANSTHPVVNNGNHLPSTSDEPGSDQRLNGEVLIHRPDHVQQNRHNTNAMYKHDTNQAHQQHSLNGAMTLDGGRQLSEDEDEDVEEEERDEVDDEDMDVVEADRTLQQDHDDEHQQPQPQPAHTSANNNSSGNVQVSSLQTTSISINSQGGNGETKSLLVKMDLNGVAYEGVLFPRPVPQ